MLYQREIMREIRAAQKRARYLSNKGHISQNNSYNILGDVTEGFSSDFTFEEVYDKVRGEWVIHNQINCDCPRNIRGLRASEYIH